MVANIKSKIAKTALFTLAKHEEEIKQTSENYAIVGGLAVQIYALSQFQDLLRPTIDADILVETIPFTEFKVAYGNSIGKMIKNKFD
ncbi:hypothetical protein JXA48_04200 [Candidatus Woesearchaeota archaeon]|nr:hypothetical protein [Candidatus Woesearchaeota archaeon]